jgi:flagellar hook-associated protein 1 FlgK
MSIRSGYSRQNAVLQTNDGQYTGAGYIGKGVEVLTIQRNYSGFLTTQATLASAVSAGDSARADKLNQLQNLFPGGANALGAAVSDMLNAFSDVASAPTDLTARTVALARVSETAARMSGTATALDELQTGVETELAQRSARSTPSPAASPGSTRKSHVHKAAASPRTICWTSATSWCAT